MNEKVFEMIFKEIKAKAVRIHTWKGTKKTKVQQVHQGKNRLFKNTKFVILQDISFTIHTL